MTHRTDNGRLEEPVRERIYETLKANGRPLSPGELAGFFEMNPSLMNYHLTVLAQAGRVRVSRTESMGSGCTRFYETVPPPA